MMLFRVCWPTLILLGACQKKPDEPPENTSLAPSAPQDVLSAQVSLHLDSLSGHATVQVLPREGSDQVTLSMKGLNVSEVTVDGEPVAVTYHAGIATIPVKNSPAEVAVSYQFQERRVAEFDGWMPDLGVSFLWPNNCGNLFPCDPDPADGVTVDLEISGYDPSLKAIYPVSTVSDGPSYMPGFAIGDYAELDLGTTTAGTHLRSWYFPNAEAAARAGTAHLTQVFDFFEKTYGPYAFGTESGSVEVDWGADSYGGMEHHPFFHVAKFDFGKEEPQIHEAAHGWFGDAVRLQCWEDFVLSEGTTTYITARGLEQVGGDDLWPYYVDIFLAPICDGRAINAVVLPDTCNEIDFETSNVWSIAPYMKGACFYEDVADLIGADQLDLAIHDFYTAHQNKAGTMREMIETIEANAKPSDRAQIEQFVQDWLLNYECPSDFVNRCRSHHN